MLQFINTHAKLIIISAYPLAFAIALVIAVRHSRKCQKQVNEMNELFEKENGFANDLYERAN